MLFSHPVVFLRPNCGVISILYIIITLEDSHGPLRVVLSTGGRKYGVFGDIKGVGEFHFGREALAYAQSLVATSLRDSSQTPFRPQNDAE
jgi:hypothetical protein